MEILFKRCTQCKALLPLESFHRRRSLKDGRAAVCKSCKSDNDKEYYKNNKEKIKTQTRKWAIENPEKSKKSKQKSHEKHRDKNKKRLSEYYLQNRKEILAKCAQWQKDNPDKVLARWQRRRAREMNAPVSDLTLAQWEEIQEAYDHRCAYCGKRCRGKLTQEHITPLSLGGSHTVTNIVPACRSCNAKKHTGPPLCPVQPLLLTIS